VSLPDHRRPGTQELQLTEDELVVTREALDDLHDELYVLACAVDDVRRDLSTPGRHTVAQLEDAVRWLLEAAEPLRDREIRPAAAH
jgi:hypothetical protein